MNEIFRDIIHKDMIIYIDDITNSSRKYKQHVKALPKVLQGLPTQQFWWKQSKCQFYSLRFEILGHLLTSEGHSADPLKLQKIFNI